MSKILGSSAEIVPPPIAEGGFRAVLVDPPRRFTNRTGKVAPEHCHLDGYGTMFLGEVREFPVGDVIAVNAHLYLWAPNALLPEGLEVMQAWGFHHISNVIRAKWRKDDGSGGRGVGLYFHNVIEPILSDIEGSMRTLAPGHSTVNVIEIRKCEHSCKPDEQYDPTESRLPSLYLEMFTCYARPGWPIWGNESDEDITLQGKAQRGYGGDDIEPLSHLEPNERMSDWLSDRVTQVMADEYTKGTSVQQISTQSGCSITRAWRLLARADAELRGRGRPKKVARAVV